MRKAGSAPAQHTSEAEPEAPAAAWSFGDAINAGVHGTVARAADGASHGLPDGLRTRFEQSLGTDLSGVRVHTDGAAAEASSALDARAYAVGQDVYMGAGEYRPDSAEGAHLLAHEVAHTVQQRGAGSGPQCKLEVSTPGDASEVDADRAAEAMILGAPAKIDGGALGAARSISRYRRDVTSWGGQVIGSNYSYLDLIPAAELFIGGPVPRSYVRMSGNSGEIHVPAGSTGHVRVRLHIAYAITQIGPDENGATEYVAGLGYSCDAAGNITWDPDGLAMVGPSGTPLQSHIFNVAPSASASGHAMTARYQFTGPTDTSSVSVTPGGHGGPTASRTGAAAGFPETFRINVVVDGATPAAAPAPAASGGGGATATANANAAGGDGGGGGGGGSSTSQAAGGGGGNSTATGGPSSATATSGPSSSNATGGTSNATGGTAQGGRATATTAPITIHNNLQLPGGDQHGGAAAAAPPLPLPRQLTLVFENEGNTEASEQAEARLRAWGAGLTEAQRHALDPQRGTHMIVVRTFASRTASRRRNMDVTRDRGQWVRGILEGFVDSAAIHVRPLGEGETGGPDNTPNHDSLRAEIEVAPR